MEATRQLLRRTIVRWLAIGFGLGLVLGLGAIFLGGNCPRTYFSTSGENRNSSFENCKNVFRFSSKNCRQDNLFRNFRNLDYRNMSSRRYFLWQFLYIKNTVCFIKPIFKKLKIIAVLGNGKLVWKVVWVEYHLWLNLCFRRYQYPDYFRTHHM